MGMALLAAAMMGLRVLRWENRLGAPPAAEMFAVGPIGPGGSVEQSFTAPGALFSAVRVAVRAEVQQPGEIVLNFRLQADEVGARILREGKVALAPGPEFRFANWEFLPIRESGIERYSVLISVDESSRGPAEFPVNLVDPLNGLLKINGIPGAAHIDLVASFDRRVSGTDILRALASGGPTALSLMFLGPGLGLASFLGLLWGAIASWLGRAMVAFGD